MNPLISVIVPVYQVERYLERAIRSILKQSYRKLEIILVDDGSLDASGHICDRLAAEDERIVVIHKKNGGLSDARNAGLDIAKGEYIVFIDSDDFIAMDFVEILLCVSKENDSDVTFCSYQTVDGNIMKEFDRDDISIRKHCETYTREQLLYNLYDEYHHDSTYFIVAWNKLYKSKLWDNIRFPKGKIHEDEATTYKIFDRAVRGTYVKIPMYAYFSAPDSITREKFSIKRLDFMEALHDRIHYFAKKEEWQYVYPAYKALADASIRYYRRLCREVPEAKREQKLLKTYVKSAVDCFIGAERVRAKKYGYSLSLRTKIGYMIFLFCPRLYDSLLGEQ